MAYIKIVDEDEDTSYDFLDEPADVIEGMQATIDFQEQRILQLESKIKELEYIVDRLDSHYISVTSSLGYILNCLNIN